MSVKTDLSWPLKIVLFVVMLGLGGAIAMWAYDMGRSFTGFDSVAHNEQLALFKEQNDKLSAERDRYSTTVNTADSQLTIEHSVQKQLEAQIRTLEAENARLKDDLAFFDSLLPVDTGQGIAIRRLKAELIAPNQLRYRLLVMQGGKGTRDFVGDLQFTVTVVQNGKSAMMIFPQGKSSVTAINNSENNKYKLGFKHYQRLEGVLTLPEGASVKMIQARVLEKGKIRAQQYANL